MEPQLEQIREQQKQSWNKFSAGWEKWDAFLMTFMKPVGDSIIHKLNLQNEDSVVLDIAAGTGEPGLTIASLLPSGKVMLTDLSEDMLAVARDNAEQRNITNIETHICDVSELPFADNTFDAVSCRFGFMFFPDMLLAAREMVRVLKPGGRIATSVWNVPEKNFWVTAIMGTIANNMQLPQPPPGAPGMFRCAKDGFIAGLFSAAGLKHISQEEVGGKMPCDSAEHYWTLMNDIGAPIVAALSKADDATKEKIKQEVVDIINRKYPSGDILIDSSALIISGEK